MDVLLPTVWVKVIMILALAHQIPALQETLILLAIAIMAVEDALEIAPMPVVELAEVAVKQIVVPNQLLQLKDLIVLGLVVPELV